MESGVRANKHAIERDSGSDVSTWPFFRSRAVELGVYPVLRTISHILSWTSLLAAFVLFLFTTRDTVEMDTPASFAISFYVMVVKSTSPGWNEYLSLLVTVTFIV